LRCTRVGILNPTGVVGWGGGFQYVLSLIAGLARHDDIEIVVFYDDPAFDRLCGRFPVEGVRLPSTRETLGKLSRAVSMLCRTRSPLLGRFAVVREHRLDCLVSASSLVGLHLRIPFVAIVYDVMYRYYPDCAEYSLGKRIVRDVLTKKLARHAALTVVDSEKSKDDLVTFYKLDPARIRPIPLCPPPHVEGDVPESAVRRVVARYRLPDHFLFYPAQLWDHKNHKRLFEALVRLRDRHETEVPVVLVGSKRETGHLVLGDIKAMGLESQIFYLGYVDDDELVALYKAATALVFPSFGDYTNIPVLEAMALGTPVVCSNLFAMPEQLGGAGLLFDPFNVDDMAEQIGRVWQSAPLRADLIEKGRARVAQLSLPVFGNRWRDVVLTAAGCHA
jgi:glycosyltransferase involved in cell wall biosynthesis